MPNYTTWLLRDRLVAAMPSLVPVPAQLLSCRAHAHLSLSLGRAAVDWHAKHAPSLSAAPHVGCSRFPCPRLQTQGVVLLHDSLLPHFSLQVKNKEDVMERYGNVAEKPSEDALLLGQTESYVEYDAQGRVIRGKEVKARSRYEEDVMVNNHTAVWGSW